ncbi:MAG: hypothetical protein HQL73_00615 [Magnetococcales bacterium]|nr:hypothetical protein [Magnetococcales bacterium]
MARYYLIGLILSLAGIALGYLLLPSMDTLALIYLRDHDYGRALELMEGQLEEHTDLSPPSVLILANLYQLNGKVDQAILVLEKHLVRYPRDLDGRKELGKLYQYAQRESDYLANLEEIHRLQPSLEVLQQLSNLHDFSGNSEKQIPILKEIIQRHPHHVGGYRDLAKVFMAEGEFQKVVDTLRDMKSRHRRELDGKSLKMLVYSLLKLGHKEEALDEARSWLNGQVDESTAEMIGELLQQGESAELAWSWVEELRRRLPTSDRVLIQWGRIAAISGRQKLALPLLSDRLRQKRLSATGVALLAELSVKSNRFGQAIRVMTILPEGERPVWLQRLVGEQAVLSAGPFSSRLVLESLDRPFLLGHPVLAAELLLHAGVRADELNSWLELGRKGELEPEWRLRLASLFLKLGRWREGGEILMAMAREPQHPPPEVFRELARYFIQIDDTQGGLVFFDQVGQTIKTDALAAARILLLAGVAGRQQDCIAWIQARSQLAHAFLDDLVHRALDSGQLVLAREVLTRLDPLPPDFSTTSTPSPPTREALERTILWARLNRAEGQTMTALRRLQPVRRYLDANGKNFYEELVMATWRDKQPVRQEVLAILKEHLGPPAQQLPPDLRREYGRLALEVGERNMGLRAFLDAAETVAVDSPEMAQLLYILGPRPDPFAMDWLLQRARRADDSSLPAWVTILSGVGAAPQAVALAELRNRGPGQHPALTEALLRALTSTKTTSRVEELIVAEAAVPSSTSRLHSLATIAEENNLHKVAKNIYQNIIKLDPDDEKALKRLGYMAFYSGEWEQVVAFLGRYLGHHDDNHEPYFYLAEVYRSLGMVEKAKPFYLKALDKIASLQHPPFSIRVTQTRIWERIGRWSEALKGYGALMREQPGDAKLKADYVELLLIRGMTREADQVLRLAGVR